MQALETTPLSARFSVADPGTGRESGVDILKEIFWRPVAQSPYGPVLAEDHVIGTKVRAPADRGTPRDPIGVFAASQRWTNTELEEFSRRHARGRFEREGLQANLTGAEWTDDEAFTARDATRPWATAPHRVRTTLRERHHPGCRLATEPGAQLVGQVKMSPDRASDPSQLPPASLRRPSQ